MKEHQNSQHSTGEARLGGETQKRQAACIPRGWACLCDFALICATGWVAVHMRMVARMLVEGARSRHGDMLPYGITLILQYRWTAYVPMAMAAVLLLVNISGRLLGAKAWTGTVTVIMLALAVVSAWWVLGASTGSWKLPATVCD